MAVADATTIGPVPQGLSLRGYQVKSRTPAMPTTTTAVTAITPSRAAARSTMSSGRSGRETTRRWPKPRAASASPWSRPRSRLVASSGRRAAPRGAPRGSAASGGGDAAQPGGVAHRPGIAAQQGQRAAPRGRPAARSGARAAWPGVQPVGVEGGKGGGREPDHGAQAHSRGQAVAHLLGGHLEVDHPGGGAVDQNDVAVGPRERADERDADTRHRAGDPGEP